MYRIKAKSFSFGTTDPCDLILTYTNFTNKQGQSPASLPFLPVSLLLLLSTLFPSCSFSSASIQTQVRSLLLWRCDGGELCQGTPGEPERDNGKDTAPSSLHACTRRDRSSFFSDVIADGPNVDRETARSDPGSEVAREPRDSLTKRQDHHLNLLAQSPTPPPGLDITTDAREK